MAVGSAADAAATLSPHLVEVPHGDPRGSHAGTEPVDTHKYVYTFRRASRGREYSPSGRAMARSWLVAFKALSP